MYVHSRQSVWRNVRWNSVGHAKLLYRACTLHFGMLKLKLITKMHRGQSITIIWKFSRCHYVKECRPIDGFFLFKVKDTPYHIDIRNRNSYHIDWNEFFPVFVEQSNLSRVTTTRLKFRFESGVQRRNARCWQWRCYHKKKKRKWGSLTALSLSLLRGI